MKRIISKALSPIVNYRFFKGDGAGGFTMIELLVVISVIGVLAVAVLSTINPIEQINKGRDTRTRSDAAQLINAAERYYAIQEEYPWNYQQTGAAADPAEPYGFDPTADDDTWMDQLVETDEVKGGFIDRLRNASQGQRVFLFKDDGSSATLYSCFKPASKAFQLEAAEACEGIAASLDFALGTETRCVTTDGTPDEDNYICLP